MVKKIIDEIKKPSMIKIPMLYVRNIWMINRGMPYKRKIILKNIIHHPPVLFPVFTARTQSGHKLLKFFIWSSLISAPQFTHKGISLHKAFKLN